MSFELPKHIRKKPANIRGCAEVKFKLMICALYGTEQGTFSALAKAVGAHASQPSYWMATQRIPKSYAVKLERLVGREIATKEWLAPADFVVEEAI